MTDRRRIYLDSCCFIDMVKQAVGTLPKDRTEDAWFLKQLTQACRDGEIEVYTSILAVAECTHAGDGTVTEKVKGTFQSLLMSGQYVKLVQPTPFIAIDARDLRWRHSINLGGADALHVASALDRKCEEFITTDGQAKKKVDAKDALAKLGLRMIRASETDCLPAKYRQGSLLVN
jgi:hypothetical protein